MDRESFDQLVEQAIADMPQQFRAALVNVSVVVQDAPTRAQLEDADIDADELLLGLYQGIPLTARTTNYGLVPPDLIYIFQKSIERVCRSEEQVRAQVQQTVRHELAHYFGISDARLDELGMG